MSRQILSDDTYAILEAIEGLGSILRSNVPYTITGSLGEITDPIVSKLEALGLERVELARRIDLVTDETWGLTDSISDINHRLNSVENDIKDLIARISDIDVLCRSILVA